MKSFPANHRSPSRLVSSVIAFLAVLLLASSAQGQCPSWNWGWDWDCDYIPNTDDWGVALTFDMHPAGETVTDWHWPTDWNTGKLSITDILNAYGAKATFFVSGYAAAQHNTQWNFLLNELVSANQGQSYELGWHAKTHKNAVTWMNTPGATAAGYVWAEVMCEISDYETVRHGWWPAKPVSFAYPEVAAHASVDAELDQWVGHVRGGPTTYPATILTTNVASTLRLQGTWLDNNFVCNTSHWTLGAWHPGCGAGIDVEQQILPIKKIINDAYLNDKIAVLAAHHFTDGRGSEYATRQDTLWAVLAHIDCLKNGGGLVGDHCDPSAPGGSVNPSVYHRFQDLPHNGYQPVPNWCQ